MKNALFSLFFAFALMGALPQEAAAQGGCGQSPVIMGKGYQSGGPCWGGPTVAPVQYTANQLPAGAIQLSAGQAVPNGYCSWKGRGENVFGGAVVGGVLGLLAGGNGRAAARGAAGGGFVGVFIPCSQAQTATRTIERQAGSSENPGNSTGPVCIFAARDRTGLTEDQCKELGGVFLAGTYLSGRNPRNQRSEEVVGRCAHDPGTSQGILNLPGHPKDGKAVCATPGDPNISRWL